MCIHNPYVVAFFHTLIEHNSYHKSCILYLPPLFICFSLSIFYLSKPLSQTPINIASHRFPPDTSKQHDKHRWCFISFLGRSYPTSAQGVAFRKVPPTPETKAGTVPVRRQWKTLTPLPAWSTQRLPVVRPVSFILLLYFRRKKKKNKCV